MNPPVRVLTWLIFGTLAYLLLAAARLAVAVEGAPEGKAVAAPGDAVPAAAQGSDAGNDPRIEVEVKEPATKSAPVEIEELQQPGETGDAGTDGTAGSEPKPAATAPAPTAGPQLFAPPMPLALPAEGPAPSAQAAATPQPGDASGVLAEPAAMEKAAAEPELLATARLPEPTYLLDWLDALSANSSTAAWATETRRLVQALLRTAPADSSASASVFDRLLEQVDQVDRLAAGMNDPAQVRALRRAAFALGRRVMLWKLSMSALAPRDRAALLETVEQVEATGLPSKSRALDAATRRLAASASKDERQLALLLENTYGCANLRVALSRTLLNRMAPRRTLEQSPVHDTVLGVPVDGNSVTTSDVEVQFLPDPKRLRMAFLVSGQVAASTSSSAGPATFVTGSQSQYVARKRMEIMADGIRLEPTEVWARSSSQLRSVETAFDGIPLVESLVQAVARLQHEQSQPAAAREVEQKISERARQRIDAEAYAHLTQGLGRLRERVFVPLDRLALRPVLVSGQTSEDRMAMRFRLAGEHEMGSATPRPQAPSDSLASLQIHESMVNNLLEHLALNGRTFTLVELSRHVATKLNRPEPWRVAPENEDVSITLAAADAVAVRFRQGRIALTLGVSRLEKGDLVWRDFRIQVFYRPEINDRSAALVRDGVVQLITSQLNNAGQIAIRGVFSKTFSKRGRFNLSPDSFLRDPRFADLVIDQAEIEDGWIGLAVGTRPAGSTPAVVQR